MTLNVALFIVFFTAVASAVIASKLSSLWDDGFHALHPRREGKAQSTHRMDL